MTGTILIVDDHPLFRQAMMLAASRVDPGATQVEAGTLAEAEAAVAAAGEALALILLDLRIPGATGYGGIALLHAARPGVPILVVSSADNAIGRHVRAFGAVGFIGKGSPLDAIEDAIRDALAGRVVGDGPAGAVDDVAGRLATLTPMQLKVLMRVLEGRLNKQIAHDLAISEATVKAHMTAVLRKLDVANRTQAALAAQALGIAELPGG